MEYRELGRTGLKISTIGMGCWAIGGDAWGPVDDRHSTVAIERALEVGINLIDTADVYGRGRSEELLGRALQGRRDDAIQIEENAATVDVELSNVDRRRIDDIAPPPPAP